MTFGQMIKFFKEVVEEAKNLSFPSKKETLIVTLIVTSSIITASLAIFFIDFIISKTIGVVFGI